jgi:hypothetical protein
MTLNMRIQSLLVYTQHTAHTHNRRQRAAAAANHETAPLKTSSTAFGDLPAGKAGSSALLPAAATIQKGRPHFGTFLAQFARTSVPTDVYVSGSEGLQADARLAHDRVLRGKQESEFTGLNFVIG